MKKKTLIVFALLASFSAGVAHADFRAVQNGIADREEMLSEADNDLTTLPSEEEYYVAGLGASMPYHEEPDATVVANFKATQDYQDPNEGGLRLFRRIDCAVLKVIGCP